MFGISEEKMREWPGEKTGAFVRDSWRAGTMEWNVREILGEFGETFRRRRQCDDGWRGKWWMRQWERGGSRKDGGEQLCCSWHLHRKHLGKLSIRQTRLIDFLHFSISISLYVSLFLKNGNILLFPLCCTLVPNGDCRVSCPEAAT